MISSKESWEQMTPISEGNENERDAAERVTRLSNSGFWNEAEKIQSVFPRM